MYNKKALSKATAELDKAKAPKKPKDIITDPMGQWKYPGLPTRIPGNDITMQGVGYPVLGVANNGQRKIMLPGADYTFPGADYVDEYPQMKKGGERKRRKTKSITGINKIMLPNPLLRNYKNRVYDPNVDYFQKGGPQNNASEERFKKRLMKRYPGMQGVYGTDGENLSIIKDPNYKASDHGFGNIEFMFPGQDSVTYTDDYQYKNPTPDQYTTVYNPKGANRGDVFLDMMHGMRDDEEYQKLLQNFGATVKKGRGRDMDHWYNVEAQENPNYVEDGREVWDNNYIDGILRAELANKTIGRRVKGNDYKLERRGSTDEIKQAAKDIKKYLKTPQKPKQYVGPVIENNGFITPEYEDGGYIEAELTDDEIEEYRKGGYIVEDISVPELNQAQKGKTVKNKVLEISDPKEFAYRKAMYDDSLTLHKQALKQTNFGLKPISKEKYEEIGNWEHQQPDYVFADKEYKKDLKNKKIKDFDDYVFDIKDPKNKKRTDEHFKQYANNFEDFAITLSDGSIKTPGFIYNGKPDFEYYDLYNPKTGTLKSYAGKELMFIDNQYMKPEKILYYGADKPDYSSVMSTESVSKEYTNKVLKNSKSKNKKYVSPHWMSSQSSFYKKPTQPVKFNKNAEKPVVIDRETVANEPIVNKSKTGDSKIINKINTTNYPEGYQPYSLYGKVLDPEVYGYAESLNGKPVQVAQFADTYGYKAKMDTYKKSGKYPWVKQEGGAKDKYATHIGDDGTVGTTSVHTDKKGNITTKVQDSKGITHYKVKTKDGKVFYKQDASTAYPENNSISPEHYKIDPTQIEMNDGALQSVDDFWTLPIGMTSAGVKGAVGLAKGLTSLGRTAANSSLGQATKAGTKAFFNTSIKNLPGANLKNLINVGFAGAGVNQYLDKDSELRKITSKAYNNPTAANIGDAASENVLNLMNFAGFGIGNKVVKGGKYLKALPGKKVVKATEDLKQAENKIEDIRRAYHNSERIITPEELALLDKHGRGVSGNYVNPVLREKADGLINKILKINKNPVLKTDNQYMQNIVDKANNLTSSRLNTGITVDDYLQTRPDLNEIKRATEKIQNKFGSNWFNRLYSEENVLNEFVNNSNFNPYENSDQMRHVNNALARLNNINAKGNKLSQQDQRLFDAISRRGEMQDRLNDALGYARTYDPQQWGILINQNPHLRTILQDGNLFNSPEFVSLTNDRRALLEDFRNHHQQSLNVFNRGSINLRRNANIQNSYTEPQQAMDDALKELHNTDKDNKLAKKIEEDLRKLDNKRIVPDIIPYHQVDQVPQHLIEDATLLSSNNLKEIDEKIDFINKALKNPNLKNKKMIKALETQLEDLHSNKWLRTGYHETMKEAGFKIPEEYKDMSVVTQNNIKYLFDSKGNLLGNITGVSKESPYIGSAGLMPYLHGTHDAGKQSQMAKTLYRSVHHGLNNAHGTPLRTRGNFAYTELLENGVPVRRKRASDMWNSGVAKGWFEDTGSGTYKVIKRAGGIVTDLTHDEIQDYIKQGYIVEDVE